MLIRQKKERNPAYPTVHHIMTLLLLLLLQLLVRNMCKLYNGCATRIHTLKLRLEAIPLNLRVRRSIILTERENCTKHSCDPRVFLTTTRDLLHISLYSPIAYQHLPGWTCAGRRSQMIHIIFITWLQELDRPFPSLPPSLLLLLLLPIM